MLCVTTPHLYQDTVTFKIKCCSVASVFVLFFHVAMPSKVPRLIKKKKKAWSPGKFWAVGRTRNIIFYLDGLTAAALY